MGAKAWNNRRLRLAGSIKSEIGNTARAVMQRHIPDVSSSNKVRQRLKNVKYPENHHRAYPNGIMTCYTALRSHDHRYDGLMTPFTTFYFMNCLDTQFLALLPGLWGILRLLDRVGWLEAKTPLLKLVNGKGMSGIPF